jgi:hypothetical protein
VPVLGPIVGLGLLPLGAVVVALPLLAAGLDTQNLRVRGVDVGYGGLALMLLGPGAYLLARAIRLRIRELPGWRPVIAHVICTAAAGLVLLAWWPFGPGVVVW